MSSETLHLVHRLTQEQNRLSFASSRVPRSEHWRSTIDYTTLDALRLSLQCSVKPAPRAQRGSGLATDWSHWPSASERAAPQWAPQVVLVRRAAPTVTPRGGGWARVDSGSWEGVPVPAIAPCQVQRPRLQSLPWFLLLLPGRTSHPRSS